MQQEWSRETKRDSKNRTTTRVGLYDDFTNYGWYYKCTNECGLFRTETLLILPTLYIGSDRYVHQKAQYTISKSKYRISSAVFKTIPCNIAWPETTTELLESLEALRCTRFAQTYTIRSCKNWCVIFRLKRFLEKLLCSSMLLSLKWEACRSLTVFFSKQKFQRKTQLYWLSICVAESMTTSRYWARDPKGWAETLSSYCLW